ncbi:3-deoxy-7-phosphoheptulonate synthase [Mycena galericulata]|nr:3-deoxy-7-phosphoheptulonate synthase [Mycena galericulata]
MRSPPSPPLKPETDSGYCSGTDTSEHERNDNHIIKYEPVIQPALLTYELPSKARSNITVRTASRDTARILSGLDDRLVVVVGPCSIHDPGAALEYAKLLKNASKGADGRGSTGWPELLVIMRCYFEKPRTTVGWKGLINDPHLDGSFQINKGLKIARQLLLDVTEMGMPVGMELLDTISPHYFSDLVSWAAIGARTTESQLHRELASGVSFPVGFKNGTDGSVTVAIDAMHSASTPHSFLGVTPNGLTSIVKTQGNADVHLILRGGTKGTNYDAPSVQEATSAMHKRHPEKMASIMIDCSHGNSKKNHLNQALVVESICSQLAQGSRNITGVMLESNLHGGRQDVPKGKSPSCARLQYGVSITDACIDWQTTLQLMDQLNDVGFLAGRRSWFNLTDSIQRPCRRDGSSCEGVKSIRRRVPGCCRIKSVLCSLSYNTRLVPNTIQLF